MAEVVIKNGNSFEKALLLFKHNVKKEGILKQLKQNRYYEKPSIRKRHTINKL